MSAAKIVARFQAMARLAGVSDEEMATMTVVEFMDALAASRVFVEAMDEDRAGFDPANAESDLAALRTYAQSKRAGASAYELCEAGHWYEVVEADTLADALDIARDNVDAANYGGDDEGKTLWIEVRARRVDDPDEGDSDTVTLDPREPKCTSGAHEWTDERVRGSGGGVLISDRCARCGLARHVDTWAQNPSTGEQGLTSTRYVRAEVDGAGDVGEDGDNADPRDNG